MNRLNSPDLIILIKYQKTIFLNDHYKFLKKNRTLKSVRF